MFNEAFGGLTASEAADLILGRRPLTDEQHKALRLAQGIGGFTLRFDPTPVGHIAFSPVETEGTENHGWHRLTPATPACRRLVNTARRKEFARLLGAPRSIADRIFTLLRGHEPALAAAAAAWPFLSRYPGMPDLALRQAGFRLDHPIEGPAIRAVREVLGRNPRTRTNPGA